MPGMPEGLCAKDDGAFRQVSEYARLGERPVLLVLFKSPSPTENGQYSIGKLHEEFPIVTIRMPYAAAS